MLSTMMIDDDQDIIDAMVACGVAYGMRVHGFTRAHDAVDAFVTDPSRFDCVVTDIYMPEMDGIELIRALRRISATIPIIAATSQPCSPLGSAYALRAAATFGATVAIQKPFSCKVLCDLAASLVSKAQGDPPRSNQGGATCVAL